MRVETVINRIEVLEDGALQIRRAEYLVRDNDSRAPVGYQRVAYMPGTDIAHEDEIVRKVAAAAWTPAVVRAHQAKMAEKAAARAARRSQG